MEKSCMCENSLDENILRSMEQEEIVYVLIDGSKRRLKKSNKFCVEKVSINWKLCGQGNLSTLCFESLQK